MKFVEKKLLIELTETNSRIRIWRGELNEIRVPYVWNLNIIHGLTFDKN
jgi:hypothetical protein